MRPDFYHRSRIGSVIALWPADLPAQSTKFAHQVVARRFVGWRTFAPWKTASGATAVQVVMSSRHVPRVAMSLAASGGRTSEPVTKEAP